MLEKQRFISKLLVIPAIFMLAVQDGYAQRYLVDYDSIFFIRDTLRPFLKRMENIHFSGYIQPQFQKAQVKGIDSYAGGNFNPYSDNRFMLRRARLKVDYRMPARDGNFPAAIFTFQFEATERDVNVRDMFVRVFEPKSHNFAVTAGLFSRPYGFEVNLSSSFRETPERGRMSQILMPSERDLGAMLSYESQQPDRKALQLKVDAGLFNGQGKSGPSEFDSFKDLIARITLKPYSLSRNFSIGAGLSLLRGGWVQSTRYRYEMGTGENFVVDSSISNIGRQAPRHYYGADIQLVQKHGWGKTEIRGEYWKGTQPGTQATTVNPGTLPAMPTFIRDFDGAFFYFLQNVISEKWELMAKYDWYDPNTAVSGMQLGKPGSNLTETDVRFHTWGIGMTHYFTDNLKMLIYYDMVRNEKTMIPGFLSDVKDNVFTWRVQMRF